MHKPLLLGVFIGAAIWQLDKQPALIETRLLTDTKPAANVRLLVSQQKDFTEESVCITDDSGTFQVPVGSFIRLEKPLTGYYDLAEPVEMTQKKEITLQPIQVSVSLEDATETNAVTDPVFILQDDEKETELLVKDGTLEIGSLILPDHSYTLRQKEKIQNVSAFPDTEIYMDSRHPEKKEITHRYEDTAVVEVPQIPGLSVSFFADEKGEHPIDTDSGLAKGTWYYRRSIDDPSYYQDDTLHAITVDPSRHETVRLEISLEKPVLSISIDSGQYHLWLENEQKEKVAEWDSDEQIHDIPVHRDSTYTLYSSPLSDCYAIDPMQVSVPLHKEKDLHLAMAGKPFSFAVSVRNQTTRQLLDKCEIRVENLSQHSEAILPAKPRVFLSGLKEHDLLRLTPVNLPSGYVSAGSTEIKAEKLESFDVMLDVIPYVLTDFQLPQSAGYELFADKECTLSAFDVLRHPLMGWENLMLKDGTYYLKQTDCGLDQYPDQEIHPIVIDSQKTSARTIAIAAQPVIASLAVKDSDSDVHEAEVQLLDENGDTVFEGAPGQIQLQRGRVYSLQLKTLPAGYTGGRAIRFRMPLQKPETDIEPVLKLQSFASVSLKMEAAPGGAAVALCTRKNLSSMAKDIHGQYARGRTDDNGMIHFEMPQGTYYVMMEQPGRYHYRTKKTVSVEVQAKQTVQVFLQLQQASLQVERVDEQGRHVSGAEMALLDLAGNQLVSWTSSEQADRIGMGIVSPGESYQIAELSAPDGYQPYTKPVLYTVPIDEPEQEETITIQTKLQTGKQEKQKQAEPVKDMEQIVKEQKQNKGIMAAAALAGVTGILFVCKKFH